MINASLINTIAKSIIDHQRQIIGPLALEQAKKVSGIKIVNADEISVEGDGNKVLIDLVIQYEKFFGQASVEVCKDALKEIEPPIPAEQLPDILK